jgi:GNAT superfamily N-acetyltransferase
MPSTKPIGAVNTYRCCSMARPPAAGAKIPRPSEVATAPWHASRHRSAKIGTMIDVRSAAPTDCGAVARLLGDLGYPTTPDRAAAQITAAAAQEDAGVLVAVDGAAVVGVASYHCSYLLAEATKACRLTSLVTDTSHRRNGIGTALVDAVEQAARDAGCSVLALSSSRRRDAAHRFYPDLGFHDASTTSAHYRKMLD